MLRKLGPGDVVTVTRIDRLARRNRPLGRSVLYYVGWVDSLVSVRSAITVEASVPARPTAERRFRNGHGFALK
jgi:hypothetical protein